MAVPVSLREAERRTFRLAFDDGLWDILIGACVLSFILVLYLGPILGDLWSSMVLIPAWALAYAAVRVARRYMVAPRRGTVKFGPVRKARLTRLTLALMLLNVVGLVAGAFGAFLVFRVPGQIFTIVFGLLLLCALGTAAYFLDLPRLYVYALLLGLAPAVGEWLWARGLATHHGLALTFGIAAGIMILVGLVIFIRLMRLKVASLNVVF